MAGEWREMALGDLTENFDSIRVPVRGSDRRPGPYPYYGASGIVDHVDKYLFDGDYLLIAEDGENLRTRNTPVAFMARGKFWVNNHAHIIRGNDQADTRFLMYALSVADVSGYLTGSTMPKLTQGSLNRIPIVAPPIDEQRAIAQILGTLDDKIELNRLMNETLETMAQLLFKSWFVDFDPVRAKMEGRDSGLPEALASLLSESLEDSEIGQIPDGWNVHSLDEIATFLNGLALQKYPPAGGPSLPVIKIAQLRSGNTQNADRANADLPANYVVHDGDVLFSWSGSLECVLWTGGTGALNQHLFLVTSRKYFKWLYYLWIHQHLSEFRHIAASKATTMGHIQRHHLVDAKVALPPIDFLREVNGHFEPIIDLIIRQRLESRTLETIRDALLPLLVSGALRIVEPDRISGVVK